VHHNFLQLTHATYPLLPDIPFPHCPETHTSFLLQKKLKHSILYGFHFYTVFYFTAAVIPAGVNVAYMCTQIKVAVDQEQKKTLWVPCSSM
jgi:hypothetical protein